MRIALEATEIHNSFTEFKSLEEDFFPMEILPLFEEHNVTIAKLKKEDSLSNYIKSALPFLEKTEYSYEVAISDLNRFLIISAFQSPNKSSYPMAFSLDFCFLDTLETCDKLTSIKKLYTETKDSLSPSSFKFMTLLKELVFTMNVNGYDVFVQPSDERRRDYYKRYAKTLLNPKLFHIRRLPKFKE